MLTAPMLIDAVLQSTTTDLDLSEVTFMDSCGLHALVKLRNERTELRVVATSSQVRRLLDTMGMTEQFAMYGDI